MAAQLDRKLAVCDRQFSFIAFQQIGFYGAAVSGNGDRDVYKRQDLDKIFWALTTISHRWEGTADDQLAFRRMVSEVPRLASDDTTKALQMCIRDSRWIPRRRCRQLAT